MEAQKDNIAKTILYWLPSILFNIIETIIILGVGNILSISIYKIIYIIAVFQITRHLIKQDKHYKNPFKCLIWSTIIFAHLFLIVKIDVIAGTICSILGAYMLSGKADVNRKEDKEQCKDVGIYLWKAHDMSSKYELVENYVYENKNSAELLDFEEILKEIDNKSYEIYKLRFYDKKSLQYIAENMNVSSTARVTEKLDEIQNMLRVYLKINKKQLTTKN